MQPGKVKDILVVAAASATEVQFRCSDPSHAGLDWDHISQWMGCCRLHNSQPSIHMASGWWSSSFGGDEDNFSGKSVCETQTNQIVISFDVGVAVGPLYT